MCSQKCRKVSTFLLTKMQVYSNQVKTWLLTSESELSQTRDAAIELSFAAFGEVEELRLVVLVQGRGTIGLSVVGYEKIQLLDMTIHSSLTSDLPVRFGLQFRILLVPESSVNHGYPIPDTEKLKIAPRHHRCRDVRPTPWLTSHLETGGLVRSHWLQQRAHAQ